MGPSLSFTGQKSLGRLQPRLVGSLRKCEEEAFAQGYCSLHPRVCNTRVWRKPAKNVYNVANLLRPLKCRPCHESVVRVRLGDRLEARSEVRRLTDNTALLRLSRSDQVTDDNQSG